MAPDDLALIVRVHGIPAPLPPHVSRRIRQSAGGCWIWDGSLSRDGYGWTSYKNHTYQAHRFVYQLTKGPIDKGLVLDHLCRVRHCVNPDHLEPVSSRENLRRGDTPTGWKFCQRCGSEFVRIRGQRRCPECLRRYEEARRERKRIAERERRARKRAASA